MKRITLEDIKNARVRLEKIIHHTELIPSTTFSEISGNQVYLKPENFQKTGSFKIRGAYNKIAILGDEEKENGVIACSAGNHAQGVALGASMNGIKSIIVMPKGAPIAKVTATQQYGAKVILYGDVYDETYGRVQELEDEIGAVFIHPFNDLDVIAGQGTIALEIMDELPEVDVIMVPIGGGGLISGIAVAAKEMNSTIKVIGVEAAGAPTMKYSLSCGRLESLKDVNSIADGITVKTPGDLTFEICQKYLDDIVTVSEEEIASAILMLLERSKLVVEGAGAVALAALLYQKTGITGKKVVPVLSGGNIDFNMITRIIERGLAKTGRRVRVRTHLKDKPGNLQWLLSQVADLDANVISIFHDHYKPGVPIDTAVVELELETRHQDHVREIYRVLKEKGYQIEIIS